MKVRSAKILTPALPQSAFRTASAALEGLGRHCAILKKAQGPSAGDEVLWVRTAAGPAIGFGHLRRSLTLARMLRSSVTPLFLLDSDDRGSQEQVRRDQFGFQMFKPGKSWPDHACPSAILIDTRKEQGLKWLMTEARRRAVPVVSIHDLGLMPLASDLAIDGSIRPFSGSFSPEGTYYCGGPSYLVLDPAYASCRRRAKRIRRKVGKIFVNLGGGDSRRYFRKVLEGLQWTGLSLDVVGVPGFTHWGQEELARECWHPLRFRWAAQGESLAGLVWSADLAITAGGLAAYEALCVGTPLCALSYDRLQRMTVQALAESGLCLDLGYGKSLTPSRLSFQYFRLAGDQELRRKLAFRGKRAVDGLGAQRVCRMLRSILMRHATEGAQEKSR
jgi:spore coat polysaccharide biosynthesis predicted glycosyltransferase SpsG